MKQIRSSSFQKEFDLPGLVCGEKKAFESIYMDFYDMLFHLASGYTGNREIAREIVQDTFLKLWEYREQLNKKTNIKNFLYTLTKNSCLNHLKQQEVISRNNRDYLITELKYKQEALAGFPDDSVGLEELMDMVEAAIEKLPEEVKITFKMNRFEGLTYRQIADHLDISPKTVEARISKALKLLRADLKEVVPVIQVLFFFLRM
ncbi:RNA polymerase sigma-70 factor [Marinilabilia salmonicolor]|jgi:RNA polymerase sigma-70 factor (ECF subfamily)|uniref:RNA polymerase sigma-70 factor (ECF subfamily) n=1 Tax=Marinilabilia salmonicolor TaxID=989 RepID=A0A2T0XPI1_9BACT|nr:RNA polymerase sigma-70 factor [Marinilabilia salmonicolor]PRZ00849.1 RNA polymerase sigma-70 factor (ECF subfamily) [Marinilabilia salmonicolor]RCW30414.1 RNA polymerase sigma-70 factor (ECF subfamily) [Marinilabilia salmonicolor]